MRPKEFWRALKIYLRFSLFSSLAFCEVCSPLLRSYRPKQAIMKYLLHSFLDSLHTLEERSVSKDKSDRILTNGYLL